MGPKLPRTLLLTAFIMTVFVLILVQSGNAAGNPMPSHYPTEGNPVPSNNDTDVYLAEEYLVFTFSSKTVDIQAEYMICNGGPDQTEITIFLPFNSTVSEIALRVDGVDHDFSMTTMELEENWWYSRDYDGLLFNLSFDPFGSHSIGIDYQREIKVYDTYPDDEIYYQFGYIVWTTRYWNHSIDHARFEYRIPKSLYEDHDTWRNQSVESVGNYIVVTEEYYDWTPSYYGEVGIEWWGYPVEEPEETPMIFLIAIAAIITVVVIFGSWEVLDRRKRKK